MNFGFDDDQQQLREVAERVLATESPPAVVRACIDDPDAWRSVWKVVVDLGWTGVAVPAAADGLGLGAVDLVALTEITGRFVLPAPFLGTAGIAAPVLATLSAPAAQEALAGIAAGRVATLADGRGGDVAWDGERLSGVARSVPDAGRADVLVVVTATTSGPAVAVLPAAMDGVRIEPLHSADPNRPLADVWFDALAPAPGLVVAADPVSGLDVALAAAAAELVGVADRVLEIAVEHASSRRQFDRPIGAFQGVKHRLADVYVAVERARTLTYNAAMAIDDPSTPPADRSLAASMAKAAASEAAVFAAKSAVQVHGAIAMTWEHDLHLFVRRARQAALHLGDHHVHYRRVGAARLEAG